MNGAIGTLLAVLPSCMTIKFDHFSAPCNIIKVKKKFMVLYNYYVHHTHFPFMWAYAVTIHKCLGLSFVLL